MTTTVVFFFWLMALRSISGQFQGPMAPPFERPFSPQGAAPMQGGMYGPYQADLVGGGGAEFECYNCLQPDGNCFEGECRGLSCFKIKGYRNGQWLTYKGCMHQFAGAEFRDGCRESSYNGIQGYMCTCTNKRYCNGATLVNTSALWILFCTATITLLLYMLQ